MSLCKDLSGAYEEINKRVGHGDIKQAIQMFVKAKLFFISSLRKVVPLQIIFKDEDGKFTVELYSCVDMYGALEEKLHKEYWFDGFLWNPEEEVWERNNKLVYPSIPEEDYAKSNEYSLWVKS